MATTPKAEREMSNAEMRRALKAIEDRIKAETAAGRSALHLVGHDAVVLAEQAHKKVGA
jgi:hypothetical protein